MKTRKTQRPTARKRVRYAVIGLGHIAQAAVLPAFANARKNSELVALISDDPVKRKELSQRYKINASFGYEDYDSFLRSGAVDAVYIALPNNMHADFVVRAARAGVHVLCEKPLGLDEDECHRMIAACADAGVKLMTAYRLHFERANMEAVRIVQSGKIGTPRIFQSLFTMQVTEGNIRLQKKLGGGTLYDIGIYCINAARYLFRNEPTEVVAFSANNGEKRFREVDEMTSAVLRFPDEMLAAFTTSFGAADCATYEVTGTKGRVRVVQAYEHSAPITVELIVNGSTQKRTFAKRDQFAPELIHFSDCVLRDRNPEPSGVEGLIDVHIIRAMYESAKTGRSVKVKPLTRQRRPSVKQEIFRRARKHPREVHAAAPSR